MKNPSAVVVALLHGMALTHSLGAALVPIPNGSFESPATATVVNFPNDTAGVTGAWESSGLGFRAVFKPGLYPGGPGCAPAGLHGLLAATVSDAGIFQDTAAFNGSGNPDLYWKAGMTYTMTVGVSLRPDITAPESGRTLNLRFFFRNADQGPANQLAQTKLTAGSSVVNNWEITEHTVTHTVLPGAPEIGKPVGIWFLTGGGTGDWTLDNVRLEVAVSADLDVDGLPDAWEVAHFILPGENPLEAKTTIIARQNGAGDPDNDGATNLKEWSALSDPRNPDSDGDSLTDGQELNRMVAGAPAPTNPIMADTDGDGLSDGAELNRLVNATPAPINPLNPDTDGDGLGDLAETQSGIFVDRNNTGTDPRQIHSDTDGFADGLEVLRGSDPTKAGSIPPASALLGRWQMNASTGTIVSSIPDATLSGRFGNSHGDSPSLTWTPAEGVDGALRLNAPGDRVEVPAPNFTHGFTVMGWIKPAALPFSPWERFLSNQFAKGFFLGRNDNTAQWRFIVNGSAGIGTMTGGNIAHGQWQHVCGSYDGSTARLFVNGIQVASQNVAAPATPIQPLYFGSENQTDPSLRGQIDEIRIYSGAVPPAQIASLYGEERALFNAAAAYTNWASSHGLSGSHGAAGADFDFDGTSNETEFALGLLPGDANSRFAIAHSGEPVTGLTLTWPSQPGLAFTIRSSSDLSDWTVIEATVPAASAPAVTTSWTTGPLSPITRFYRVELAPTLSR